MIVPAGKPGEIRFVEDARLVVEVLSKSTMHIDFGEKLDEYRRLEGLQTSMIISQKPAEVWIWCRDADDVWPEDPAVVTDPTSVLDIPDLDIAIALDEVYQNVT